MVRNGTNITMFPQIFQSYDGVLRSSFVTGHFDLIFQYRMHHKSCMSVLLGMSGYAFAGAFPGSARLNVVGFHADNVVIDASAEVYVLQVM